jgi:alpha-galactosidase
VSSSIKNVGNNIFKIRKFSSAQIDLDGSSPTVYSFDGSWAHERILHQTILNGGRMEIDSDTGSSSCFHNPLVIVKNDSTFYGLNLLYSGNHKTSIEVGDQNHIRIKTGINDFLFAYEVKSQETFYAPEAVIEVSDNLDDLSLNYQGLIRKHILPENKKIPPLLFNSWEGVYFNFNHDKIIGMARKAKDLGAELFVLDDGWFANRNDDSSSLGDWFDNPTKTGGIASLADEIRSLGLQFGIWMEPEMISENSLLYKKHPEYAMTIPSRPPIRQRNQLMLDLTNDEVLKFVFDSVCKVLDKTKASYLKWDYNRNFTDVFSSQYHASEYGYRYIVNLYKVMKALTEKYPQVLFEGCASGGARYDLGILSYFPQIWCSDNTDPLARLYIQSGTHFGYPNETMCCHVSSFMNDISHHSSRLEDRFNIALAGNLGYELDPTKLSRTDIQSIKKQIEFYKSQRSFLLKANSYLLGDYCNSAFGGFELVSSDKNKALAIIAITGSYQGSFFLKGLNPRYHYTLNHGSESFSGLDLMKKGIPNVPPLKISGSYTCKLKTMRVLIEKTKR